MWLELIPGKSHPIFNFLRFMAHMKLAWKVEEFLTLALLKESDLDTQLPVIKCLSE